MPEKHNTNALLEQITELSHQFGTTDYVRGGGGNTSVKNHDTLWVKPSGTTLGTLTPGSFVVMNRNKISKLYDIQTPQETVDRESLVKKIMTMAVDPNSTGRPSVEAPLHNSLSARFVVHTHPALVNGMTCSLNGKETCQKLFPTALWLDFIDPGYTLCMRVKDEILDYKKNNGIEPEVIFLKNHGVFVAADSPKKIHQIYNSIMDTLKQTYNEKGISIELPIAGTFLQKDADAVIEKIIGSIKQRSLNVSVSGIIDYANGPVSPDHIVYSKSYPFKGEPTAESLGAYKDKYGYWPNVVVSGGMVFGVAETMKKARLALEMFIDGGFIKQLADAFGGIEFMNDQSRVFIENWEVESYRSKQI